MLLGEAGVRTGLGLLWLAAGILELQPADFAAGFARLDLAQAVMGEPAVVAHSILLALGPFETAWPMWNALAAAIELGFGSVLVAGGVVAARGPRNGRVGQWCGAPCEGRPLVGSRPIEDDRVRRSGVAVANRVASVLRRLGRFERPILVASALCALLLWWVGEGFGGLPTGFSVPLGGAPGPALLYALLAALAWPRREGAEAAPTWRRAAWRLSWVVVWWGSAVPMVSWTLPAAVVLRANLVENGIGQPALLRGWGDALASAIVRVGASQVALAIGLAAVAIGLAGLLPLGPSGFEGRRRDAGRQDEPGVRPPRSRGLGPTVSRLLLGFGILLGVLAWVFVQDLGGLAAPGGTDVGLGPPLVLLALAGWPCSPRTARRAAAPAPELSRPGELSRPVGAR